MEPQNTSESTQTAKPRYSVSRKGVGGRKEKYTAEMRAEVMALVAAGKSLLEVAKEKNYPYVSIRSNLKKHQMWPVTVPTTTPEA